MIVRREVPSDEEAVRALFAAVMSPELIDGLRASDSWLPALSFVALGAEGEVVGHVAGTRGQVGSAPALALVPPSIGPDDRGRGIGQALMYSILGAAEALGEPLVGLVAVPPEYYARFGFHPAEEYSIAAPVDGWRPYFLVRPLTAYQALLGRTLPAFIVGVLLCVVIAIAAVEPRIAWLDERKTVIGPMQASGYSFGLLVRAPDGALLSFDEAFELAPPGEEENPDQWLVDHGYEYVQLGVTDETIRAWTPYEVVGFSLVGLATIAATGLVVSRRRPT